MLGFAFVTRAVVLSALHADDRSRLRRRHVGADAAGGRLVVAYTSGLPEYLEVFAELDPTEHGTDAVSKVTCRDVGDDDLL